VPLAGLFRKEIFRTFTPNDFFKFARQSGAEFSVPRNCAPEGFSSLPFFYLAEWAFCSNRFVVFGGARIVEQVNGSLPALAREGQPCSSKYLEMPVVRIPVSKPMRPLEAGSVKASQLTMREADSGDSSR
jgi:hypothetical protein